MSIYKHVMGEEFFKLHPMLQKRYEFVEGHPFRAKGVMKIIKGGPIYLYPFFLLGVNWKLLFPEHGQDVPFMITNTTKVGAKGEEQIHWERIFYFSKKKRYFNALMSLDAKRLVIKDYLGEPSLVYSDLVLKATSDGHLQILSRDQRLYLEKSKYPYREHFRD